MRYLKVLVVILFIIPSLLGCVAKYSVPEGAQNDMRFVGEWKGEHFNTTKGNYWRKWTQTRSFDGTYRLVLDYYNESGAFLNSKTENGYWWLKDGLFHEINPSRMSKPETYNYEFLKPNQIKFTSVTLDSSSDEKESYSFVDIKIE